MKMQAMTLSDLMAQAKGDDSETPRPDKDAQIMMLRESYERYVAPCPFKPGDLITPKAGHNNTGAGDPHIVLEVRNPATLDLTMYDARMSGSSGFGCRYDIRVMCLNSGKTQDYTAFWVESYIFISWEDYLRDNG